MELNEKEKDMLYKILNTEIEDTRELVKTIEGNDKQELEEYLKDLEELFKKFM